MLRFSQFAGGLACAVMLIGPAAADIDAQNCAVSGFNGKFEGAGGMLAYLGGQGGRGHGALSLSMPLGCMFGVQLDVTGGGLDNEHHYAVGSHLFTRDPDSYLLGVYAEYAAVGKNDIGRVAVETELYFNRVTFTGLAGYEYTDVTKDGFIGMARATFYLDDNFEIHASASHFQKVTAAHFGAEWQPEDQNLPVPMTVFFEVGMGDRGYGTAFGGLRFHFGGAKKSLIRRHREDDPINYLNVLKTITRTLAELNELCGPGEYFDLGDCACRRLPYSGGEGGID